MPAVLGGNFLQHSRPTVYICHFLFSPPLEETVRVFSFSSVCVRVGIRLHGAQILQFTYVYMSSCITYLDHKAVQGICVRLIICSTAVMFETCCFSGCSFTFLALTAVIICVFFPLCAYKAAFNVSCQERRVVCF